MSDKEIFTAAFTAAQFVQDRATAALKALERLNAEPNELDLESFQEAIADLEQGLGPLLRSADRFALLAEQRLLAGPGVDIE